MKEKWESFKEKVRDHKVAAATGLATITTAAPMTVFAASEGTANSAVVSAMTDVANDMIATAEGIIPVALSVVGVALIVVFGVSIFKRIASRA